ncbi:Xanthohumol 4-O-methyltransferase [Salvia divinorum]|uniref:Xanthohumol 4-O-methyltransferase n=1 Tax=Salvia divinorum TaxID=28513 RepID=A0ABD1I1Z5_SALDI
MAFANGLKHELLDSQTHVWNHLFNYINSMTLKCAIQLGIPDAIHKHDNPMTLFQLADALSINSAKSDALHRLMWILVHSKFFDKVKISKEDTYCLTGASRLLLRHEPLSMASFALVMLDSVSMDPWHRMSEWFRDERSSPFETEHGFMFWECWN